MPLCEPCPCRCTQASASPRVPACVRLLTRCVYLGQPSGDLPCYWQWAAGHHSWLVTTHRQKKKDESVEPLWTSALSLPRARTPISPPGSFLWEWRSRSVEEDNNNLTVSPTVITGECINVFACLHIIVHHCSISLVRNVKSKLIRHIQDGLIQPQPSSSAQWKCRLSHNTSILSLQIGLPVRYSKSRPQHVVFTFVCTCVSYNAWDDSVRCG